MGEWVTGVTAAHILIQKAVHGAPRQVNADATKRHQRVYIIANADGTLKV